MSDEKKKPQFEVPDTEVPAKATKKGNPDLTIEPAPSTRQMIRELMEEMMPAMAMAMQAGILANRPVDPRAERAAVAGGPKCPTCRQLVKACGGKHKAIVVYPEKYPEFGAWFRGVGINGVWYRSDNGSQVVQVPEDAADDILQNVRAYEENERETRMGRSGGHDFGNIKNPVGVPAGSGWR